MVEKDSPIFYIDYLTAVELERAFDGKVALIDQLSPWPEQRSKRTESDRHQFAVEMSAHLPEKRGITSVSEDDLAAMKAAFIKRFDEQLPRTETLMAVANIGYRMALRDLAK